MSADRCEPAAELRGVDGWHWLETAHIEPMPVFWSEDAQEWMWSEEHYETPEAVGNSGWTYITPVPSPADFAALVKAARDALEIIRELERNDNQYYSERARLEIAIEAFPQPKDTDNAI